MTFKAFISLLLISLLALVLVGTQIGASAHIHDHDAALNSDHRVAQINHHSAHHDHHDHDDTSPPAPGQEAPLEAPLDCSICVLAAHTDEFELDIPEKPDNPITDLGIMAQGPAALMDAVPLHVFENTESRIDQILSSRAQTPRAPPVLS